MIMQPSKSSFRPERDPLTWLAIFVLLLLTSISVSTNIFEWQLLGYSLFFPLVSLMTYRQSVVRGRRLAYFWCTLLISGSLLLWLAAALLVDSVGFPPSSFVAIVLLCLLFIIGAQYARQVFGVSLTKSFDD